MCNENRSRRAENRATSRSGPFPPTSAPLAVVVVCLSGELRQFLSHSLCEYANALASSRRQGEQYAVRADANTDTAAEPARPSQPDTPPAPKSCIDRRLPTVSAQQINIKPDLYRPALISDHLISVRSSEFFPMNFTVRRHQRRNRNPKQDRFGQCAPSVSY
jgi:hypothetical protein